MSAAGMSAAGVIGVTGLPCSGKSFAAELIASGEIDGKKRLLLKADDIGHELLLRPDVREKLRERFGGAAATRRTIAEKVFANPAELEWLENIIHPLVTEEILRAIETAGGNAVIEAALLFAPKTDGLERRCETILIVEADFPSRLARAAARGWSENELRRREERQLPLFAGHGAKRQDNVVRATNSGSSGELRDKLSAALTRRPA